MTRRILFLAAVLAAATPSTATAQSVWIGGRAGTFGAGFDVSVAANDWFILRAGTGGHGAYADLTSVSGLAENRTGILTFPNRIYTLGADIEVGNFRIGGGMLYKDQDPYYAIKLGDGAKIDIGEGTYTEPEVTRLTTTLHSEPWAPYVLVGFGQHTSSGLGLFLDAGVAFLDQPRLSMSARGDASVLRSRQFRDDLRAEQRDVRDDVGDLVRFWPILNLGVRYGIGGRDRDDRRDRERRRGRR